MKNKTNRSENKLSFFCRKYTLNYFFYGLLFIILSLVHIYHIHLVSAHFLPEKIYFMAYAVGELALELILLLALGAIVRAHAHSFWNMLFIIFTFFLFLSQLIDFPLVSIMDMSIWFAYDFVSDETYTNFIEMLLASNVSLSTWLLGAIASLGLIAMGIFIFKYSEKLSKKYPVSLSCKSLMTPIMIVLLVMCIGDLMTKSFFSSPIYDQSLMTLPWKNTLWPPNRASLRILFKFKTPQERANLESQLNQVPLLQLKPNIYLFIIESLRDDYIDAQIAPHIHDFKKKNIFFDLALSNSNATQISWFSLFYSKFPFYWTHYQPSRWNQGSISLRMLKNMGYRTHVYSSSRLEYYQMDKVLFGDNYQLIDSHHFFPHGGNVEAYESDKKTIDKLCEDIRDSTIQEGNCYIVFLDSTHFDYSWPKDTMTRFVPIEEKINYIKASTRLDVEGIRNRYRNSIFFIDSLFGNFINVLKQVQGDRDSIIVLTGDHGEEFFEQGHLFHASNLSRAQTHIPIYYKFGDNSTFLNKNRKIVTTHMDIFPSIFEFLTDGSYYSDLMEGQSVFSSFRWPFAVTARYNAGRIPYEFSLHNGTVKLIARFNNEKEVFKSNRLYIIGTKNLDDENLPQSEEIIKEYFSKAVERIFCQ